MLFDIISKSEENLFLTELMLRVAKTTLSLFFALYLDNSVIISIPASTFLSALLSVAFCALLLSIVTDFSFLSVALIFPRGFSLLLLNSSFGAILPLPAIILVALALPSLA